MNKNEKFKFCIDYFQDNNPAPATELYYSNPFELLVAVILSAQCTDKRVNMVTPELFEAFPDAVSLAKAEFEEVFPLIRSISYPNNKAKHLIGMANMLVNDFDSNIPSEVSELKKLPGVGQKTANVVASVIYDKPTIPVDTHVYRVAHRIGLVTTTANTPLKVENQLTKKVSPELRGRFHHWLILHGRYVCKARKPECENCGLMPICKYYRKTENKASKPILKS